MSVISCKSVAVATSQVIHPSPRAAAADKYVRLGGTCGASTCTFRDVVDGGLVVHRSDSSGESSAPTNYPRAVAAAATRHHHHHHHHHTNPAGGGGGGGVMQLRRLSGCYECRAVSAEPASRRYPRPAALCPCPECGELFTKPESLEMHLLLHHAGPKDSGRNIVEIIFKSSWQKRNGAICKIDRILRVHNAARTIARFEECRAAVKDRAAAAARRNHPNHQRCVADCNELLRFHAAPIACNLGWRGSAALCRGCSSSATSAPPCGGLPRHPPRVRQVGARVPHSRQQRTGHDRAAATSAGVPLAMLVCRVIAGRVRRDEEEEELPPDGDDGGYDSVARGGCIGSAAIADLAADPEEPTWLIRGPYFRASSSSIESWISK